MKIVHVCTLQDGGAAIAVRRLHHALLNAGMDSQIFVLVRNGENPRVHTFDYRLSLHRRVVRSARARLYARDYRDYRRDVLGQRDEFFTTDRCHLGTEVVRQLPDCDCVHLHWISGFLDYRVLCRRLLDSRPAAWTLHDMNPFTGGCHYTQDCTRFRDHCGSCPLLGARTKQDVSKNVFERKRSAMSRVNPARLSVVAPSRWIAAEARSSPIFSNHKIQVIPHPIDTDVFAPAVVNDPELAAIRACAKRVVLFIAHSGKSPRKGYRYLLQALEIAALGQNALLLTVGGNRPPSPAAMEHRHFTHIEDASRLNQIYNLADVCVVPSVQEAFGMTAQEALAAGTPVIGFDTGGCADLIRSGENGLLVEVGDAAGLARALHTLLKDEASLEAMGRCARERICSQTGEPVVAAAYLQVYQTLLAQA